jgi:hypothetical protein
MKPACRPVDESYELLVVAATRTAAEPPFDHLFGALGALARRAVDEQREEAEQRMRTASAPPASVATEYLLNRRRGPLLEGLESRALPAQGYGAQATLDALYFLEQQQQQQPPEGASAPPSSASRKEVHRERYAIPNGTTGAQIRHDSRALLKALKVCLPFVRLGGCASPSPRTRADSRPTAVRATARAGATAQRVVDRAE